jgi:hypothetical protein
VGRPFDYFNHATFGATLAVLPNNPHLDAVLVQNSTHFIGRQVNIAQTVVTHDKAVAITMALYAAFNFDQCRAGGSQFFDI